MSSHPAEEGAAAARAHAWWQERLAARFFSPCRAGQRVRLSIDADDFPIEGSGVDSLIQAVRAETGTQGCGTVLDLLASQAWQFECSLAARGDARSQAPVDPPPVLPGLIVLVLAVHHGGGQFAGNNYYARLRALMGYSESHEVASAAMSRAQAAWSALEKWSCQLLLGRRGLFELRSLGGMRYIGVPLRQALLSPDDELALEQSFAAGGLEPGLDLSASAALRMARRASLRARARNVLSGYPTAPASLELVDDVLDVYEAWNGRGSAATGQNKDRRPVRLRFQLSGHSLHDVVATCLVPSGGDYLPTGGSEGLRLERTERRDGSAELIRSDGSSLADDLDWFGSLEVPFVSATGIELGCFRESRACRWFLNSGGQSWVERFEDELDPGQSYVEIRRAGEQVDRPGTGSGHFHQGVWQALAHPPGLIARMFRHEPSARHNAARRVVLRMRGGIRTEARGNSFYDFALPELHWPKSETLGARVFSRILDDRGNVVGEAGIEPFTVNEDWGGFGGPGAAVVTQQRASVQPTVDALLDRGLRPALVEAFFPGQESKSKVRIYLETTPPPVRLQDPPRRSRIGALDSRGPLSGRVGIGRPVAEQHSPATQLGRPLKPQAPIVSRHSPHDRLCRLLRSRVDLSWTQARSQIRQCGRDESFDDRHNLTSQLFSMHQMGLVEIVESEDGGLESVRALPPRLAVTVARANLGMQPGRGLQQGPRFLLTGAWLPRELEGLREAVASSRGLIFHQAARASDATLLPPERCIIVTSEMRGLAELRIIAGRLGVQFEEKTPDALSSLACMAPISDVASLLDWRPGIPGAGYDTFEFDPDRICRTRRLPDVRSFHLRECKRRDSSLWTYFVVDRAANRHARVHDRQLGRWLVRRAHAPDVAVPVDNQGALLVPLELRLPRHLERALALESGRPPETVWFGEEGPGSPFLDPSTAYRFRIPQPTSARVRPYEAEDRCSHAFLRYPGVTALWSTDDPMPVLECRAARINTLGLNGER